MVPNYDACVECSLYRICCKLRLNKLLPPSRVKQPILGRTLRFIAVSAVLGYVIIAALLAYVCPIFGLLEACPRTIGTIMASICVSSVMMVNDDCAAGDCSSREGF